jgi:3-hydroxybutyrate dehydrogenase
VYALGECASRGNRIANQEMLRGKCALITGSVGGIGFATAKALAAQGCNIVLNGFAADAETIAARRREIAAFGVKALYHGADLRDAREIGDLVAAATAAFGAVDILVNNAVVRCIAPIEELPIERWEEALAVNLTAPLHLVRHVLPGMRANTFGRIVNMVSMYSFRAAPNRIDYVTTKTALLGMTRAVAVETAKDGITCNAVMPGSVETPPIAAKLRVAAEAEGVAYEAFAARYVADKGVIGRFVAAESVAAMIAFLCGPGAADITGSVFPVDGGWTAT